jgi:hypothetical protein
MSDNEKIIGAVDEYWKTASKPTHAEVQKMKGNMQRFGKLKQQQAGDTMQRMHKATGGMLPKTASKPTPAEVQQMKGNMQRFGKLKQRQAGDTMQRMHKATTVPSGTGNTAYNSVNTRIPERPGATKTVVAAAIDYWQKESMQRPDPTALKAKKQYMRSMKAKGTMDSMNRATSGAAPKIPFGGSKQANDRAAQMRAQASAARSGIRNMNARSTMSSVNSAMGGQQAARRAQAADLKNKFRQQRAGTMASVNAATGGTPKSASEYVVSRLQKMAGRAERQARRQAIADADAGMREGTPDSYAVMDPDRPRISKGMGTGAWVGSAAGGGLGAGAGLLGAGAILKNEDAMREIAEAIASKGGLGAGMMGLDDAAAKGLSQMPKLAPGKLRALLAGTGALAGAGAAVLPSAGLGALINTWRQDAFDKRQRKGMGLPKG